MPAKQFLINNSYVLHKTHISIVINTLLESLMKHTEKKKETQLLSTASNDVKILIAANSSTIECWQEEQQSLLSLGSVRA